MNQSKITPGTLCTILYPDLLGRLLMILRPSKIGDPNPQFLDGKLIIPDDLPVIYKNYSSDYPCYLALLDSGVQFTIHDQWLQPIHE